MVCIQSDTAVFPTPGIALLGACMRVSLLPVTIVAVADRRISYCLLLCSSSDAGHRLRCGACCCSRDNQHDVCSSLAASTGLIQVYLLFSIIEIFNHFLCMRFYITLHRNFLTWPK